MILIYIHGQSSSLVWKTVHFHISNLRDFSGEDRFKNVELLQQLFGTKIICSLSCEALRVSHSFKRRCFSDLVTNQHSPYPSVSTLGHRRKQILKESLSGQVAQHVLSHQTRLCQGTEWTETYLWVCFISRPLDTSWLPAFWFPSASLQFMCTCCEKWEPLLISL